MKKRFKQITSLILSTLTGIGLTINAHSFEINEYLSAGKADVIDGKLVYYANVYADWDFNTICALADWSKTKLNFGKKLVTSDRIKNAVPGEDATCSDFSGLINMYETFYPLGWQTWRDINDDLRDLFGYSEYGTGQNGPESQVIKTKAYMYKFTWDENKKIDALEFRDLVSRSAPNAFEGHFDGKLYLVVNGKSVVQSISCERQSDYGALISPPEEDGSERSAPEGFLKIVRPPIEYKGTLIQGKAELDWSKMPVATNHNCKVLTAVDLEEVREERN